MRVGVGGEDGGVEDSREAGGQIGIDAGASLALKCWRYV